MGTILTEDEWLVAGNESDESIARCDETYQLRERVGQLERLNATLAAQVDRMEKVVEAAIDMQEHGCGQCESQLNVAVITYKEQMIALGKGGGG